MHIIKFCASDVQSFNVKMNC